MSNRDNSWVDSFERATVDYLISRDYKLGGFITWTDGIQNNKGEIQKHMDTCPVKTVHDVDQEAEEFGVIDSYDSNAHRSASVITAAFSCECGKYTRKSISHEATIGDVINFVS